MEDNTEKYKTYKIGIMFEIDVPKDMQKSILNSVVIGINDYKNMMDDFNIPIEAKNDLITRIQNELEQLKIKEYEQ